MFTIHRYLAPAVLTGAAALAILAAPAASAADAPHMSCVDHGGGNTLCESPGNVQLTAAPPAVQYGPQYPYLDRGPIFIHHVGGGHGMGGHR